ncbi:anti-sigma factor antagonist [Bacillus tianshenii]|nr:anti-sigma factor antagonist [Bacillus tianshenii]
MNLKVDIIHNDSQIEVSVFGEVDAYTAPKLRESLIPLTEEEGVDIFVNLAGVDYMDSTGLGVFIGALKSSRKHNSTLKLHGMTDRVERLFQITGLNEVMDIETSPRGETQ